MRTETPTLAFVKALRFFLLGLLPAPFVIAACGARTGLRERGLADSSNDASAETGALPPASDGSVDPPDVGPPVAYDAGAPVPQIASGLTRSCVVRPNGGVRCWGSDYIGNGAPPKPALTAVDVIQLAGPAVQISVGMSATCVRLQSEGVQCWGDNQADEPIVPGGLSYVPVTVPGLAGVLDISVGASHACVVLEGGGVKCWGANYAGCLGVGLPGTRSPIPVGVMGLTESARAVTAKANVSCALLASGRVQCWGTGSYGQLGDGSEVSKSTAAAPVPGIVGATAIANGRDHVCVVTSTGGVKCWGSMQYGQLGNGILHQIPPYASLSPVDVIGLTGPVKAISAGDFSTCVLLESGGVQCWGSNEYSGLGDGTPAHEHATATGVSGLDSGVDGVGVGWSRACALMLSGGAKCWGRSPLGDGTTLPSGKPVDVLGLP